MKKNKIQKDKKIQELVKQKDVFLLFDYIDEKYDNYFSIIPNKHECLEIVGEDKILVKGKYWCLVDYSITREQTDKLEEMGMWLLDDLDNLYE
jgi:hypothetical protein